VSHRGITIHLHRQRWRWRARIDSRQVVRSFSTADEARRALDVFLDLRTRLRARAALGSSLTVGDLCDRWLERKIPLIAPGTAAQYEIHIRVHILPIAGCDANDIRPVELERFYATLRWKAAKESHNVLRQAFDWGLANEILHRASNPCLVIRPSRRASIDHDGNFDVDAIVRPVREKGVPLTQHIEKLLADAEERGDRTWWLYLKVAATIGARPGEVCALQRKHVDSSREIVRIEWSADKVSGRIKRPKSPWSVRTLALPCSFFTSIEGALPPEPETFLFPSNGRRGQTSPLPCWNARSVKRRLDAALKRTGLPHFTPHALRHYVATRLLDQGLPPLQLARFLGHADDSLVRKLYGNHIVDETQRLIGEAAARLA
jgi:integrase